MNNTSAFILIISTFSSIHLGLDDTFKTLVPKTIQMYYFCYAEVKFWLLYGNSNDVHMLQFLETFTPGNILFEQKVITIYLSISEY